MQDFSLSWSDGLALFVSHVSYYTHLDDLNAIQMRPHTLPPSGFDRL